MSTYTWITAKTPKNIYTGRTIKHLKERANSIYSFSVVRIAFRFETVYCAVYDGKFIGLPGNDDVKFITKALRLEDGNMFLAAGDSDPYAKFNSIGVSRDSCDGWSEIGRAWVGSLFE